MNGLLKIILSLSISGALLILVLLLCKPLVKDKFSKRWQYYIWLAVIVRLLFPFAPETNLMGMVFQHFDKAMIQADTSLQPAQEPSALPETGYPDQDNVPGNAGNGEGEYSGTGKMKAPGVYEMVKQNIAVICLLIWLIVAIGLLIRKITIYQSFVKYIQAGRIEITDMQLWECVGKLITKAGIKKPVGLYTNSLIASPLLIGFFRPCIMLPTAALSESDFENTILHELTHYKRHDLFYKWLVQVTICLHWFNPFAYVMGREINRYCELSCDEAVIKSLDMGGRRAYGDTLLNAMDTGGKYKESLASVTLSEGTELLKERLEAIMKFSQDTKWRKAKSVSLMIAMLCLGFVLGAYTDFSNDTVSVNDGQKNNKEYGLTIYVDGEDISEKIIRLWNNANNIYNVDDIQTFQMGEPTVLFDDAPEYIEILNYDQEVDAVFSRNGKEQLEQAALGGPYKLIQKKNSRVYRMGPWKTGYSYAEALEGMSVIQYIDNTLIVEVKYKKPLAEGEVPVFGYTNLTIKKIHDEWLIDSYVYPESVVLD